MVCGLTNNADVHVVIIIWPLQAGMSLGFNLAGSLAAIDKWVQDMRSEDETEGDGEGEDTAASADSGDEQDGDVPPSGRELLFSFGAATGRPRTGKKDDSIGKHWV